VQVEGDTVLLVQAQNGLVALHDLGDPLPSLVAVSYEVLVCVVDERERRRVPNQGDYRR
jgi:hypothetical protein